MAKRTHPERPRRIEAEREYAAAYVGTFYPGERAMFDFRLGDIVTDLEPEGLTQEELNIIGAHRRFADAVVVRSTEVVLIETAIRPALGKISTLHGYSRLAKVTPELAPFRDLPLRLELVGCIYDPVLDQLCREQGIKYVTWTTPASLDYLRTLALRMRRPPKTSGFV
jgi:hypothetical protein